MAGRGWSWMEGWCGEWVRAGARGDALRQEGTVVNEEGVEERQGVGGVGGVNTSPN